MNSAPLARGQQIQVIARAAEILRLLSREDGGLSLGQIAAAVELPRSTVQRIVGSLVAEGLASSDGSNGGIRLGPEIQSLARAGQISPQERLRPVLKDIAKATGETVDLAILRGDRMLFVDQIEGSHRLRTVSSIGETFPLTTTANGKAALACLEEVEATRLILSEPRAKPLKDGELTALLGELGTIRAGALACDRDEHSDGISALGFGLVDPTGEILAISVPVPSSRFARLEPSLTETLAEAKANLSQ